MAQRVGFSLLELSIGLVIMSVLATGALTVGGVVVEQQQFNGTKDRVAEAKKALMEYFAVNGRLPCAARFSAAPNTANYGVEVDCTAVVADTTRVGGNLRIGALPVRTLGLRDSAMGDEYGNRILYAVSEDFTNAGTVAAGTGRITMRDGGGNAIATAGTNNAGAFVVFSTGPDGKGGYRLQTGAARGGCTGGLDTENCNGDAVFRDAKFNNATGAAAFYDDMLAWAPKYLMTVSASSTAAAGTSGQVQYSNGGFLGASANFFWDIANNRLGIGTSSPTSTLSVNGLVSITGQSPHYGTQGWLRALQISEGTAMIWPRNGGTHSYMIGKSNSASGLYFGRSTTDDSTVPVTYDMVINSSGNVGIGTAGPLEPLDVQRNAETQIRFASGASGGGYLTSNDTASAWFSAGADWNNSTGWTARATNAGIIGVTSANGGELQFYSNSGLTAGSTLGPSLRMRINSSGNVGIGTPAAPEQRLHVNGPMIVGNSTGAMAADGWGPALYIGGNTTNNSDEFYFQRFNRAVDQSDLYLALGDNSDGNDRFIISAAGTQRFLTRNDGHTAISANVSGYYALSAYNAGTHGVAGNGALYGLVGYARDSSGYGVHGYNLATAAQGNLGQTTLGVVGYTQTANSSGYGVLGFGPGSTVYCGLGRGDGWALVCSGGNAWINGTTYPSDARLKEKQKPITDALDTLMALKPMHYYWRENTEQARAYKGKPQVGLMAQDVEKILPNIVTSMEMSPHPMPKGVKAKKTLNQTLKTIKGVEYDKLIPYLIRGTQELKAEQDRIAETLAQEGSSTPMLQERWFRIILAAVVGLTSFALLLFALELRRMRSELKWWRAQARQHGWSEPAATA
jgi:prepilin-type N-terminal cleavage/methylation domain-containing protein